MVSVLQSIQSLMETFIEGLKAINVDSQNKFEEEYALIRQEFIEGVLQIRDKYPEMLFLNYNKSITETEASTIFDKIASNVSAHCSVPAIPNNDYYIDKIQDEKIVTPVFMESLDSYNEIYINPNIDAKLQLNQFLLGLLLSMPIKKIRLNFVDLSGSFLADFFYTNVNPIIYNQKPITNTQDFKEFLKKANDKVLRNVQRYGDVRKFNEKNNTIIEPYEVIVLLDNMDNTQITEYDECILELSALKRNCAAGGIFVVDFITEQTNSGKFPPKSLVTPSYIEEIPNLKKACLDYINTHAMQEDKHQAICGDYDTMYHAPYDKLIDRISIPVGRDGVSDVNFTLDLVSHVHSFILGQSGSGKSVFLHNVISGAMMKYAPEDLELYLLDFKLGGVEFNRYKNEKHVHAMLVDNSDQQITLEILRELRERMTERGKLLRSAGVTNLREYNQQNPDKKLQHILFVADECHEMFRVGDDIPRFISNEISDVIIKIAKEGRNQGVHLLLATQTLSGTEISSEILNNISDHYLLKCSIADSERMVSNSSEVTSSLSTGQVLYHHVDESITFQAYFTDKDQSKELMSLIFDKSKDNKDNSTFYFSGASLHHFDINSLSDHKVCKRKPVAFFGKSIDMNQKDIIIPLGEDFSENILIVGLNDMEQTTRVTMNAMISLALSSKYRGVETNIKVIDCLSNDESEYAELFDALEEDNLIQVIQPKQRSEFIAQLAQDVVAKKSNEMFLFILGQDRFRELKLDLDIKNKSDVGSDDITNFLGSSILDGVGENISTFKNAFNVILDKGPELGIHTIMQLEKPSNFLFMDYLSPKDLFQKFKHLVLLKSDDKAGMQMHLRDDVLLDQLSKDPERLRAYYYAEESDTYTLFTPYVTNSIKELKSLISKI